MPPTGVTSRKRARQYEHIKESAEKQGRSSARAKQIAAATVNKQRREAGETRGSRKGSGGSRKSSAKKKTSGTRKSSSRKSSSRSTTSRKRSSASRKTTSRKTARRKTGSRKTSGRKKR